MKVATEIIEDDDVVMVEPIEITENNSNGICKAPAIATTEDTINLDDLPSPEPRDPEQAEPTVDKDKEDSFVRLLKNNTLMNKIVERTMNMENNAGMARVIQKTLVPLYKSVNTKLKESESFTEMLYKTLRNLKYDPKYKFLHIKTLCEELKAGQYRKKVPFITIATSVKLNPRKCSPKKSEDKFKHLKKVRFNKSNRKKTDVIDLDKSDDEPVITLEDDDSDKDDIMIVEENCISGEHNSSDGEENIEIQDKIDSSNESLKENSRNIEVNRIEIDTNTIETNKNVTGRVCSDGNSKQTNKKKGTIKKTNKNTIKRKKITHNRIETNVTMKSNEHIGDNINKEDCSDSLLVPYNSVNYTSFSSERNQVMAIEQQIKEYKEKIIQLEQAEVITNCNSSPYVLCDKYKASIVTLYKKLCKITGHGDGNLMKQRVVRLHVVEGHPPGPVKRLERFLNSTIDSTGSVPLPDFYDVVRCVTQSNIVDQLGWNKQDIMKEAFALFTHCGQALQKQRQKREYKDLMNLVQDNEIDDHDPANEDPILLRQLEENKLIAKANEEEVIESYVRMENLPRSSALLNPRLGNVDTIKPAYNSDSDSDFESDLTPQKKENTEIYFPNLYVDRKERESSEIKVCTPRTLTQCITIQNVYGSVIDSNAHNSTVETAIQTTNTAENSTVKTNTPKIYTDLQKLQKIGDSNRYVIAFNSDTEGTKESHSSTPENEEVNTEIVNTTETKEDVTVKIKTEIKTEPLDIQFLLDRLGDNYSSTIFDIEDPFVVIDISDSSDDDL